MDEIGNISKYALFLIHPDGLIDKALIDEREFHMQYYYGLIKNSKRLQKIVKKTNVYLPEEESESKYVLTYELDSKLAEKGIISIHNLFPDKEVMEELNAHIQQYYIALPQDFSKEQKIIFKNIIDNNDLSESWFAISDIDNKLKEISYDDVLCLINNKRK